MIEFMNMKCEGCGYYVDCKKDEFEERGNLCEDCYEKKKLENN